MRTAGGLRLGGATYPNARLRPSRTIVRPRAHVAQAQHWHNTKVKHVVEAQQFSKESLDIIFREAVRMEQVKPRSPESRMLEGLVMATLFYEPSTRTRLSFEAAVARLGGQILSTESAGEYSSAAKGETLEGARAATCRQSRQRAVRQAAAAVQHQLPPAVRSRSQPGSKPARQPASPALLNPPSRPPCRHHPHRGGVRGCDRAAPLPAGLGAASSQRSVHPNHQRRRRAGAAPHAGEGGQAGRAGQGGQGRAGLPWSQRGPEGRQGAHTGSALPAHSAGWRRAGGRAGASAALQTPPHPSLPGPS
jgi:hypothetical protein